MNASLSKSRLPMTVKIEAFVLGLHIHVLLNKSLVATTCKVCNADHHLEFP